MPFRLRHFLVSIAACGRPLVPLVHVDESLFSTCKAICCVAGAYLVMCTLACVSFVITLHCDLVFILIPFLQIIHMKFIVVPSPLHPPSQTEKPNFSRPVLFAVGR
uniref:Uncharacterized protein n=1 Tax=Opuntia streptacantha TaxID=393608 RepID=A0A7C9DW11_OPUST